MILAVPKFSGRIMSLLKFPKSQMAKDMVCEFDLHPHILKALTGDFARRCKIIPNYS